MGIREKINKHPAITAVVIAALAAGGIGAAIYQIAPMSDARITITYFSDDNGQTYFIDSVDQLPPFDHNGKEANLAYVFKGSSGKPFVGFLQRYTSAAKVKLAGLLKDPQKNADAISSLRVTGSEIKRPADAKWVSSNSVIGNQIIASPGLLGEGAVVSLSP